MLDTVDGGASDAVLLEAVRAGDLGAYGVLFGRHAEPLLRAAARFEREIAERQDLVAEAFVRVLLALRRGNGPRDGLRSYLLVTMRNLAVRRGARTLDIDRFGDLSNLDLAARVSLVAGSDEIVVRRWKCQMVSLAFRTLPRRWRYVLWALEIEGASPRELAPRLGLSPNAVASLALRAREGLRRAYLQALVPEASEPRCRPSRQRLALWIRGELSGKRADAVAGHLARCTSCRGVAAELAAEAAESNARPRPWAAWS